jgi:glycine cleavage system aminomethyltransferase T
MDSTYPEFKYSDIVPYGPQEWTKMLYTAYVAPPEFFGVQPFEYTGWQDETVSWHENCYIHSGLNPVAMTTMTGSDCEELFKHVYVNSFEKFDIGSSKQAVEVDKNGKVVMCGVLMHTGENEYMTSCLSPTLDYHAQAGGFRVKNEPSNTYLFQLAGPRSLEVVEAATGEDLHDIPFAHHRMSKIAGKDVRIIRIGMAGTLAYEVHGKLAEDPKTVYTTILKAGKKYGLRRLGTPAYDMTHWEAGFPQMFMDFLSPYYKDETGLGAFMRKARMGGTMGDGSGATGYGNITLKGSVGGSDIEKWFRNPIELGWGRVIRFDHDFIGADALSKIVESPKRKMVTLEWDVDDIMDIHRSQYQSAEPYRDIAYPNDLSYFHGEMRADKVLKNGREVGISTGRMNSYFYRNMISICSIDREFSDLGTEVAVLWGDEGTRQKEVCARVARYPYVDKDRNETVDVSTIPFGYK